MIRAGWSPSVRLFEAAACGVPIISDWWDGLSSLFEPDTEILIAKRSADVLDYLQDQGVTPSGGPSARGRGCCGSTAAHRARARAVRRGAHDAAGARRHVVSRRRFLYCPPAPIALIESCTSTRSDWSCARDMALSNADFDFAASPLAA